VSGLIINIAYDLSVNSAPPAFKTAVAAVVQFFQSHFLDPVTVNINVGYGEVDNQLLGSGALGESITDFNRFSYSQIRNALALDAKTADDSSAVASLPMSDPISGSHAYWMATAEAKSLGLLSSTNNIDGYVGLSSIANIFDYDNTNGVTAGQYDFYGVVAHEISEVMGRQTMNGEPFVGTTAYEPLDLFHYSSPGHRTFSGSTAGYFSIDGGQTNLDSFNTNSNGDFGDWAASAGNDAFLAFSQSGVLNAITATDLKAMDILGWDISSSMLTISASSSQLWGSSANHATGTNFFGPGGGSADILIIADHSSNRTVEALQIENGNLQTSQVIAVTGFNIAFDGSGDFNHDGLSDLLAHTDLSSGVRNLFAYQMTPVGVGGTNTVANLGQDWITDAFGDFNGDGTSDILLHHDSGASRTFEVLSMNNYAVQSAPIVQVTGVDWSAVGTGDFNHDGTSDILEQRIVGGSMNVEVVALQNNVVQSVSLLATIGADWQIDGTGDFNQDGTSDFLMHRDSGGVRTLEIVTINNNTIAGAQVVAQVGANFKVDGIGDFNHDGTNDIAMHADTGTTRNDWIFTVANNVLQNAHVVATTGIDWHVS
jgi:hypothetical protein